MEAGRVGCRPELRARAAGSLALPHSGDVAEIIKCSVLMTGPGTVCYFLQFREKRALTGVAQWIEHRPEDRRARVWFPVRAHAELLAVCPAGGV